MARKESMVLPYITEAPGSIIAQPHVLQHLSTFHEDVCTSMCSRFQTFRIMLAKRTAKVLRSSLCLGINTVDLLLIKRAAKGDLRESLLMFAPNGFSTRSSAQNLYRQYFRFEVWQWFQLRLPAVKKTLLCSTWYFSLSSLVVACSMSHIMAIVEVAIHKLCRLAHCK